MRFSMRLGVRLSLLFGLIAGASPADEGARVVIGGALEPDNEAIYRTILDLAVDERPICVLPTASAEPKKSLRSYLDDFERWGGPKAAVGVGIEAGDLRKANGRGVVKTLASCGGFFFTGGDQSRIVDTLRPDGSASPADKAIRGAVAGGAVIAGTSAGAAAMSDPMIGGGASAEALTQGVAANDGDPGVWVRDGMGWLDDVLVDQHCLARGRLGRLFVALRAEDGERLGACVDEDTAMIVRGETATVVGVSGVAFLDVSSEPARLWLLGDGDRFDLHARTGEPAKGKHPSAVGTNESSPPEDPWKDDALHRFLVSFSLSADKEVRLTTDLMLRKSEDFRAFGTQETQLFAGPFEWLSTSTEANDE